MLQDLNQISWLRHKFRDSQSAVKRRDSSAMIVADCDLKERPIPSPSETVGCGSSARYSVTSLRRSLYYLFQRFRLSLKHKTKKNKKKTN